MLRKTSSELVEPAAEQYVENSPTTDPVPDYLQDRYWWAYLHPRGLRFFERQWVINSILWGNYTRLRDSALDELGASISGRTLQIACVYGNLTPKLAARLVPAARLDVVDAATIQLQNLSRKMNGTSVSLHCQDAASLRFGTDTFDQVLMFFLLHELPLEVKKQAIDEALRVLRPGGKLVFVDYHLPPRLHPHRYFMPLVFKTLEPFALEMWDAGIDEWIKAERRPASIEKRTYFGGLYQKVVMRK